MGTTADKLNKLIENVNTEAELIAQIQDIVPFDDALINGNLTQYTNNRVTSIGRAFDYFSNLTTVSFPAATTIGSYAFYYCTDLTTVSFPSATTIENNAFQYCSSLKTANFPVCTTIGDSAFQYCSNLTTANFPKATTIGSNAFYCCSKLTSLYLTGSSVVTLGNSSAFYSTPMKTALSGKYGSIYVPASLLTSYKAATNWTYYSARIVGI